MHEIEQQSVRQVERETRLRVPAPEPSADCGNFERSGVVAIHRNRTPGGTAGWKSCRSPSWRRDRARARVEVARAVSQADDRSIARPPAVPPLAASRMQHPCLYKLCTGCISAHVFVHVLRSRANATRKEARPAERANRA